MTLTNYDPAIDPRDIEDRVELTPAKETTPDMYREDTIADPEGVKERQEAQDNAEFPDWILHDFELDVCNIYGVINPSKKNDYLFPDGKYHLRPRMSMIESIMEIHTQGMEDSNLQKMIDKSTTGSFADDYDHMNSAYCGMITELPSEYHFNIVSSVGNAVNNALALRAYERYNYASTKARYSADAVMPEWLKDMATRTSNQNAMASVLYRVHKELWSMAGWKNSPQYPDWIIRNEVVKKCNKQAEYRENNNRNRKRDLTVSDWSTINVMDL